jgi:alpha-N-arabinofuranosidase
MATTEPRSCQGKIASYPGRPLKESVPKRLMSLLLLCSTVTACAAQPCEGVAVGKAAKGLEIAVGDDELKRIGGEFFGFNLENTEFQLSLWDSKVRRVPPEVVAALKPFRGAVYRFPGGTTANYYPWREATGEAGARGAVRINDWTDLPRIDFGLPEYLHFVDQVGGQAWYVLNLQGGLDSPSEVGVLAAEARELARHLREKNAKLLRWELGNELDRAQDLWPSEKYRTHARAILAAVRAADPSARFVGMMADYDAQSARGITSSQYNRAVVSGLKDLRVHAYEQHLYYDGPPEGPHLPNRLGQLCRSIDDARKSGVPKDELEFWVTEHGRWPQGKPGEPWKLSWRKTADLGAAIGVADLLIALTQIPEVRGSALHALHGTNGPWPLFHQTPTADGKSFTPSATLVAYQLLNQSMLPVVLPSRSSSSSRSGYEGGYDARGAVLASPDRNLFSVWTINRDRGELTVTLKIPLLAGKSVPAKLSFVSGPDSAANNYERHDVVSSEQVERRLNFDDSGNATYQIPALSVAALSIRLTQE